MQPSPWRFIPSAPAQVGHSLPGKVASPRQAFCRPWIAFVPLPALSAGLKQVFMRIYLGKLKAAGKVWSKTFLHFCSVPPYPLFCFQNINRGMSWDSVQRRWPWNLLVFCQGLLVKYKVIFIFFWVDYPLPAPHPGDKAPNMSLPFFMVSKYLIRSDFFLSLWKGQDILSSIWTGWFSVSLNRGV